MKIKLLRIEKGHSSKGRRTDDSHELLWRPGFGQYRPDSKKSAWTEYETLLERVAK